MIDYDYKLTQVHELIYVQVDANSIGSVLPAFAHYGLLSGMIGYFIHQLTAGLTSSMKPHIISLS